MSREFFVVTTCSASGWRDYGERMVASFLTHWAPSIRIVLYAEGFEPPADPRVIVSSFPAWFQGWKERHLAIPASCGRDRRRNRQGREYDYRYDCVRFAHKIAALADAGDGAEGVMLWVDADTVTHAHIDEEWLGSMLPAGAYMSWLERGSRYPECGFMMFDTAHPFHVDFMTLLRETYRTDAVFRMCETHDSYVTWQLVRGAVVAGKMPYPASLSGRAVSSGHPFVHGPLGARMDHLKGKRKAVGRTPKEEVARREGYWR